jgi:hypothetical protein
VSVKRLAKLASEPLQDIFFIIDKQNVFHEDKLLRSLMLGWLHGKFTPHIELIGQAEVGKKRQIKVWRIPFHGMKVVFFDQTIGYVNGDEGVQRMNQTLCWTVVEGQGFDNGVRNSPKPKEVGTDFRMRSAKYFHFSVHE